jgi:hypothetical protein
MKILLFALLMCSNTLIAASDPIAKLVEELSKNPMWENGKYPSVHLPRTAKPAEVVAAYFAMTRDPKEIKNFEIKKTRSVEIPDGSLNKYTAVWCQTEVGDRIILMKFISLEYGWFTRSTDARSYE